MKGTCILMVGSGSRRGQDSSVRHSEGPSARWVGFCLSYSPSSSLILIDCESRHMSPARYGPRKITRNKDILSSQRPSISLAVVSTTNFYEQC